MWSYQNDCVLVRSSDRGLVADRSGARVLVSNERTTPVLPINVRELVGEVASVDSLHGLGN